MTRVVTILVMAVAVSLSGLVLASPASAVSTSVGYTLTSGDPVLTTELGADSTAPCVAGSATGTFPYKVLRFRVGVTGPYTVTDSGPGDGRVGLYTGAFNPADPTVGCLAFVDVDEAVTLTAGTLYTLVQSTSTSLLTGAFSVTFDGAGVPTAVVATTTTLTSTPNPSELSKATTLRAVVAGGTTPTGTVQFRDGTRVLGSAALSGGVAQLAVASLAVGNHNLSATYPGDAAHDPSVGSHVHKVKYGPKPKVKLRISDRTPYVGQKLKLSWVTTGADTVKAAGDWKGKLKKKGHRTFRLKDPGRHVFKIRATNVNGFSKTKIKVMAERAPKKLTVSVPTVIVAVDSTLRVRTAGLAAKERFKVFLDDELLRKGYADKRGAVNALVRIPKGLKEGEHTLTVTGSNESRKGSLTVTVVAPKELDVELKKAKVKADKSQTVVVKGLVEGESVTVLLNGDVVGEGTADAKGEFELEFSVGDTLGKATVRVEGQIPARNGEDTFEVTAGTGPQV